MNENNCRSKGITSERVGNPELKAAIKCVHEYIYHVGGKLCICPGIHGMEGRVSAGREVQMGNAYIHETEDEGCGGQIFGL